MADDDFEIHAWPPRTGGQQAGHGPCGVLVLHLPTGLAAVSTEHRSQLANRAEAMTRLRGLLAWMATRG